MPKTKTKVKKFHLSPLQIGLMSVLLITGLLLVRELLWATGLNFANMSRAAYNPRIRPQDFTTKINNRLFSLPPGKTMTYLVETEEGTEKIQIEILDQTKTIMGVETLTYWDRVWLDTDGDGQFSDQELVEETFDYLAQDRKGNVWYFGEEVDNYEDGVLVDHDGSWLAGVDGALPGIWIKNRHRVGDSYLQEYLEGEAEDTRDVVATNVTVTTSMGTYKNCVQFFDWTPLDSESREYKFYCPEVRALVMSQHLDAEDNVIDTTELVELIDPTKKSKDSSNKDKNKDKVRDRDEEDDDDDEKEERRSKKSGNKQQNDDDDDDDENDDD